MSDTISLPIPISTSTLGNTSNQSNDKENNDKISLKVSVATMKAKPKINNSRTELVRSNDVLAKRLNQKKMETKMLRDKLKKSQADIIKYRQVINYLMIQRGTSRTKIGAFRKNISSLEEHLTASKLECEKLREELDNFNECGQENDIENLSYLANTTLLSDLKKSKAPNAGKNSKRVVNMVRPMKCGFVVGNPVVSLKRLRRQPLMVVRPPMPVVSEDSEAEEESETEDTSATSDSSRASSPEPPTRTRERGRAVPAVQSPPELVDESLVGINVRRQRGRPTVPSTVAVRRKPAPAGKSTRQSVAARPALMRRETYVVSTTTTVQLSSPAAPKPTRRDTFVVATNQQPSSPSTSGVNSRASYAVSGDQQTQLKPCRVMMKDIMSNTSPPVAASMLPVVVLDRVTAKLPNLALTLPRDSANPRDSVNMEVVPMDITGIVEQPEDTSKAQTLKESMAFLKPSLNTIVEEEADVSQTADTTEASTILPPDLNMSNITVRTHSASPNPWATPLETTFVGTSAFKSNTPDARRSIDFDRDLNLSEEDVNNSTVVESFLSTLEEHQNPPVESQSNAGEDNPTSVVSDHEKSAETVDRVTEEDTPADNDSKPNDPQLNTTYEVPKKLVARKVKAMPMSVKLRNMSRDKKVSAETTKESSQENGRNLDESLTDDDDDDESKDNQKLAARLKAKKVVSSDEESQQTTTEQSESEEETAKLPAKQARKRIANVMSDSENEQDSAKKMKLETKPCPASKKKVYVPKPRSKKSPSYNTSSESENQTLDSTSQDSLQSNCSSSSSGSTSSEERSAYMQKFMDRVNKEDPLEGTSRAFEVKKKAPAKTKTPPSKKSMRLHKKMQYAESPLSPKPRKSDDSWKPRKKTKKLASKKKAKAADGKNKATKKSEKET